MKLYNQNFSLLLMALISTSVLSADIVRANDLGIPTAGKAKKTELELNQYMDRLKSLLYYDAQRRTVLIPDQARKFISETLQDRIDFQRDLAYIQPILRTKSVVTIASNELTLEHLKAELFSYLKIGDDAKVHAKTKEIIEAKYSIKEAVKQINAARQELGEKGNLSLSVLKVEFLAQQRHAGLAPIPTVESLEKHAAGQKGRGSRASGLAGLAVLGAATVAGSSLMPSHANADQALIEPTPDAVGSGQ